MNIPKDALRRYQAQLNGLASLFAAAEMELLELTEDHALTIMDSLKNVSTDLLADILKTWRQQP